MKKRGGCAIGLISADRLQRVNVNLVKVVLILSSFFLFSIPHTTQAEPMTVLSDDELEAVEAKGFYFRIDLSLEAFTESSSPPQVVFNTGTPLIIPTESTAPLSAPLGSINLTGSAQSNISSLINVIGATSVINIGVNIVSITNSTNDVINSTNINTGAQGTNFDMTFSLLP